MARLVGLNVLREGDVLARSAPSAVTVSLHAARGLGAAPLAGAGAERRAARGRRTAAGRRGAELIADVTPAATAELGLVPGRGLAAVKETAVQTYARR